MNNLNIDSFYKDDKNVSTNKFQSYLISYVLYIADTKVKKYSFSIESKKKEQTNYPSKAYDVVLTSITFKKR